MCVCEEKQNQKKPVFFTLLLKVVPNYCVSSSFPKWRRLTCDITLPWGYGCCPDGSLPITQEKVVLGIEDTHQSWQTRLGNVRKIFSELKREIGQGRGSDNCIMFWFWFFFLTLLTYNRYTKLHIFNVYTLLSLGVCIHP